MDNSLRQVLNSGYFVSEGGDVFSTVNGSLRKLSGYVQKNGYKVVKLRKTESSKVLYRVHRLIAEAFVPNPDNKPDVNHIDGNKTNNAASNLEWVTPKENIAHAIENNLFGKTTYQDAVNRGNARGAQKAVFTVDEASELLFIKQALNLSVKELAKLKGCGLATMYRLVNGQTKIFKE